MTFFYDSDGQRVKKVQGGQTTAYLGAHYEKNVTPGVTTTYYYAGSTRVALRQGSAVYYLHADHLGSASLTTDASGNKVGELRYLPYGQTRYTWGATPTDRRFTGHRSEEATLGSLYDYGARFYSPYLNRFISADTIVPSPSNPQSLNRYSYVLNNALKYVDPTGHAQDSCRLYADDVCVGRRGYDPQSPTEFIDWARSYGDTARALNLADEWYASHPDYNIFNDWKVWMVDPASQTLAPKPEYQSLLWGYYYWAASNGKQAQLFEQGNAQTKAFLAGGTGTVFGGVVYRGLARDEDPSNGLSARAPNAGNSPISHVAGQRESQWIATTKSLKIAIEKYGKYGVVKIDLSKVKTLVVDFSKGIQTIRGSMISNWAKHDQEVLIQGHVPPQAIERLK